VDVRSEPGSGGPDVECDAVSLGVEVTGFLLRFAGVAEGEVFIADHVQLLL
jgi:hypothetical protein